ncbi:hypothetical protein AYI70_g680 [Smittium culicis]|uniref:Core-binding (CB) domain-containing protein n=1 Tax=Smittium culicis TaxID=133412 RepID=A0A1R1YFQ1_9FUNG|nr:hypothetical protein AYI70_g680 [Smittium culicis]
MNLAKGTSYSLEWESVPVQSASVRIITEPPYIYKDSSPDSDMDENTMNPNICISGQSIDPGRIEGEMRIEYSQGSIQANGTWLQNKDGKIDNEAISIDKASWNGNKLSQNESESTLFKDKGPQKRGFEITENCCGIKILLRIIESIGGVDAHQRQRIIDNIICSSTQECYSPFKGEQEDQQVLQLVSGSLWVSFERTELQLEEMEQPIRLPSMEPNITSYTENSEGTTNNNIDYFLVENCSMVPISTDVINSPPITAASRNGSAGSKKLKISAVEQQELVSRGMENQRCTLKAQGFSDTTVDIIVSKQCSVRRRSRQYSIQQKFLDWHQSNNNTTEIQVNNILNYLAHIFTTKKLSENTIRAYKSAIFNLVVDSKSVENSPCMNEFLIAIDETEIKSFFNHTINISPVIERLIE